MTTEGPLAVPPLLLGYEIDHHASTWVYDCLRKSCLVPWPFGETQGEAVWPGNEVNARPQSGVF